MFEDRPGTPFFDRPPTLAEAIYYAAACILIGAIVYFFVDAAFTLF